MMTAQDIAHRDLVDLMPEIGQGALNTAIPPGRIFFGQAHDKLFNVLGDTGSAKPFSGLDHGVGHPSGFCARHKYRSTGR